MYFELKMKAKEQWPISTPEGTTKSPRKTTYKLQFAETASRLRLKLLNSWLQDGSFNIRANILYSTVTEFVDKAFI
jgi:hypothetical protein